MRIILILSNPVGELDRSNPIEVKDEESVTAEVLEYLESEDWVLSVGDSVRIGRA